jgi:mannose-1-phosphate guanylyltransferase/mannose-6-phosphate isomerase
VARAYELASQGYIVTFGAKPTLAETGFGYIKAGKQIASFRFPAFKAEKFIEKPNLSLAKKFLKSPSYYWNSGIFLFKARIILKEVEKFQPELFKVLKQMEDKSLSFEDKKILFEKLEPISIDYAVMEKSDKIALIPADFGWNDVGSLLSLEEFNPKDKNGNVIKGNVVDLGSKKSIIFAEDKLVATIGLRETVVIDTHDATLIAPKERLQEVKKVVETLKKRKADEYLTPRTVERPWGSFTVLNKGPGYKLKMVTVKPRGKLSYQLHRHRSEHWVIIAGTARVTRNQEVFDLKPNESTFIPPSTPHRLENPGRRTLKLIEVQIGKYVEEDDIVRFDDLYGRNEEI